MSSDLCYSSCMSQITITFTADELAVLADSEASIYNLLTSAARKNLPRDAYRLASYQAAVQKIATTANNTFGD